MKKEEIIFVPNGESPLNVLAKLGERTKNAWIYFHKNAVNKMKEEASEIQFFGEKTQTLWFKSDKDSEEKIVRIAPDEEGWYKASIIVASDIAFKVTTDDCEPEERFFLQMEE